MTKKLTTFVNVAALCLSLLLALMYVRYDLGILNETKIVNISETVYSFLARCYFAICFWLALLIVARKFKKVVASNIICICCLIALLFSYRLVYLEKSLLFENPQTVTTTLQVSFLMDVINFSLILVLAVVQIFSLYRVFRPEWRPELS